MSAGNQSALAVSIKLGNQGVGKVQLGAWKVIKLYGVTEASWAVKEKLRWGKRLLELQVLEEEEWVESSEVHKEEILMQLTAGGTAS